MEFRPWPKITRVENRRAPIFTEKIDGTNACIAIGPDGEFMTQSRNRIIVPGDDNFGFAAWAYKNKEELLQLGEGYHFGEWWGEGVGRTYGMTQKYFSLFNTARWSNFNPIPHLVGSVPILPVSSIAEAREYLQANGSIAVKQFGIEYNRPEGAVMFDLDTKTCFKIIMDK